MLEADAKTYKCPHTNSADCVGEDCLVWRSTNEVPKEGYCKFVGDVVRVQPGLTVTIDNIEIANGGTYAFGSIDRNKAVIITIKLNNTGTGFLKLTGDPIVSKSGDSEFSIMNQPLTPIAKDMSSTFKIKFLPVGAGAKSGQLSIVNNDLDNTPFVINLSGTGV